MTASKKDKDKRSGTAEVVGGEDGSQSSEKQQQGQEEEGLVAATLVDAEVVNVTNANFLLTPGGKLLCFGIVFLLVAGVVSIVAIVFTVGAKDDNGSNKRQAPSGAEVVSTSTTSAPSWTEESTTIPTQMPPPPPSRPPTPFPTPPPSQLPTQMPTHTPTRPPTPVPTTQAPTRLPTPFPTSAPTRGMARNCLAAQMEVAPTTSPNVTLCQCTPCQSYPPTISCLDLISDTCTGPFSEVGKLTALTSLTVYSGSGVIPTQVGLLSNTLKYLSMRGSTLGDSIPTQLGQLTALTTLLLRELPSLYGTIPTELGQLTALRHLEVSHTSLSSTIPPELRGMNALEEVKLFGNRFSGSIPSSLCNLPNLKTLQRDCPETSNYPVSCDCGPICSCS